MRTIYVKTGDWKAIFATVKLQAFTAGYQDLCEFLNQARVDQHGRLEINAWNDQKWDLLNNGKQDEYNVREKQAKVIAKQARELGIKVMYNDVGRMNLRGLA